MHDIHQTSTKHLPDTHDIHATSTTSMQHPPGIHATSTSRHQATSTRHPPDIHGTSGNIHRTYSDIQRTSGNIHPTSPDIQQASGNIHATSPDIQQTHIRGGEGGGTWTFTPPLTHSTILNSVTHFTHTPLSVICRRYRPGDGVTLTSTAERHWWWPRPSITQLEGRVMVK